MFDPSIPATNAELTSLMFRDQFNGLKTLIDAVPGLTDVVIDSVTTLPPGAAATASASLSGTVLHLEFGIPAGDVGAQGNPGNDGAQGPPFASAVVDTVDTVAPNDPATVGATFDGTTVHLSFGIPAGQPGADGPPGEVTTSDMNNAIANAVSGTSANSNGVDTLETAFLDAETEALRQKLNELLLALRR